MAKLLETENLGIAFGGLRALSDVTLEIGRGDRRPDRAKRRRKDDGIQPADGCIYAHGGTITPGGQEHRRGKDISDHPRGHRPDLPEYPAVQGYFGDR